MANSILQQIKEGLTDKQSFRQVTKNEIFQDSGHNKLDIMEHRVS